MSVPQIGENKAVIENGGPAKRVSNLGHELDPVLSLGVACVDLDEPSPWSVEIRTKPEQRTLVSHEGIAGVKVVE